MSEARQLRKVRTTEEALDSRIESLSRWLVENAASSIEEQAHLDDGTRERAYWHYGYLIALRDVRDLLRGKPGPLN